MINEISCDKGHISSNDNKNIDTIAENFLSSTVLTLHPRRGCTKGLASKPETEFAVLSQNGCEGLKGNKRKTGHKISRK